MIEALQKEEWFKESNILLSVDTWKSEVAEKSIKAGAHIINDVTAGQDPKMFEVSVLLTFHEDSLGFRLQLA